MSRRPSDSPSKPKSKDCKQASAKRQKRLFEDRPSVPDYMLEKTNGSPDQLIAGVDEAGRGPLAGPVVAAAVILDPANIPEGLNDSKKLSEGVRHSLFTRILTTADVAIASTGPSGIDRTNILLASLDAMRRALDGLIRQPDHALIDGRDVPQGLCCAASAVVRGDARSLSIAAASIVAKVTRDRMMRHSALIYPNYSFENHVGYGTRAHLAALSDHGPCVLHRMSFRPIRVDAD
ncbi:ribonuclease HII [Hoeflea sp. CAU 1731]